MASLDSLRIEDLNDGRPPLRPTRQPLSRIASMESVRTDDLPRAEPVSERVRQAPAEHRGRRTDEENHEPAERSQIVVDRAKRRQLQHQISLQCISSAIASATARRGTGDREPSLRAAASHGDLYEASRTAEESPDARYYSGGVEEDLFTLPAVNLHSDVHFNGIEGIGIQLDDLDEVPDDPASLDQHHAAHQPLRLEELYASQYDAASLVEAHDSDDELDTILQSHFSEDEEDHEDRPSSRLARAPSSPHRSEEVAPRPSSPVKRHLPVAATSPVKASSSKRPSDKFAFATPTSPVKAHVELPIVDEDEHVARAARPLPRPPAPPAAPSSPRKAGPATAPSPEPPMLRKTPSGASLKRNPGVLRKAGSTRSIRSAASSVDAAPAPVADASRALGAARSPSIASPRVSPILASGTTVSLRPSLSPAMASPSSPVRRVVKTPSPSLRPTRSMAELRSAPSPSSFFAGGSPHERVASPRKSTILPSVKNKVAALETRQATLSRFATTSREGGRARVPTAQLARADSIMSTASSVVPSEFNLNRVNSMASFKAPLLKRGATVVEQAPPVPSLPAV